VANTVRIERVILTELDSSSQIYMSICVINETMPAMRENAPAICDEEGLGRENFGSLTVPHDPYPRALDAIALQQVKGAAIEQALSYGVLFAGCAHGEVAKLDREYEAADCCADAEEQRKIGEYEERVLRAVSDGSVEIRLVFDEGEKLHFDDCK
jgi:hypothetical protein